MFKISANNSSIRFLILTVVAHYVEGTIQMTKNDLRNALSCFTEGIEVKCKDDYWNFKLYRDRLQTHRQLGEFRLHICFPL